MPTETTLNIDLDDPKIIAFVSSSETKMVDPTYEGRKKFVLDSGFEETEKKRPGPPFNPDAHVPIIENSDPPTNGYIGIVAAEIKTYDLYEKDDQGNFSKFVSKVETQLVHSQHISIAIWHQLFVSKTLSEDEKDRYKEVFENFVFDDTVKPDPNDYAFGNAISANMYEAPAFFEITKVGGTKINDSQDKAIRDYYSQGDNEGKFKLVFVRSRFEEVREIDDGSYDVADPDDSDSANDIVDQIIGPGPAETCEHLEYKNQRVATLISYPEFKIVWRRVVIKVGCVRISIKVPQLWYRNSKRVLYAVIAHKIDVSAIVENVIVHCLKSAALKGTLAGLVTANPAVGAAAFKAAFKECVTNQLLEYLKCLFAELVVLKEKDRWKPV